MSDNPHPPQRAWLWLAGWCFISTTLLYYPSFTLPFFFDDLDHLPYIETHHLTDLWQSSGGFPYYRPWAGTIWWVSYQLLGYHSSLFHHALNLLLHAGNGWLLGWLASQWAAEHKTKVGWLAATGYIFYPFSYQAVAWVGAVYHLWATFLVLLAVASHTQFQHSQKNGWWWLALLAAGLAPFAHENGMIAPLLMIGYTALHQPWRWRVLGYGLAWAGWGWAWLRVQDGTTAATSLNHAEAIGQNMAYFGQGLAYPWAWVGGWLHYQQGWNDLGTAVGLTLIALLLLLWLNYPRPSKLIIMGSALLALASLPAILLLDFAYVISGPRLLLMPSAGIALVWAGASEQLWRKPSRIAHAALFLLLWLTLAQNGTFVRQHLQQHTLLGRVWWQAVEIATAAQQAEQTPILINFPTSMTAPRPTYALGHEGTVFMVPYIFPLRIVQVNGAADSEPIFHNYEDTRPTMPYFYDVLGSNQDWPEVLASQTTAVVYHTHYTPNHITLTPVGAIAPAHAASAWQVSTAEHGLHLMDSQLTHIHEQQWQLTLHWQPTTPLPWGVAIFVHLIDEQGQLVGQADGQAWGNTLPLAQWPVGSRLTDQRTILMDSPPHAPIVGVHVGLYDWHTGERVPLITPDGRLHPTSYWFVPAP